MREENLSLSERLARVEVGVTEANYENNRTGSKHLDDISDKDKQIKELKS